MTAPEDEFDWCTNESIVVHTQRAIAVYENPEGAVVIREERGWCDEEDRFIVIRPENIPAVIRRMLDVAGLSGVGLLRGDANLWLQQGPTPKDRTGAVRQQRLRDKRNGCVTDGVTVDDAPHLALSDATVAL